MRAFTLVCLVLMCGSCVSVEPHEFDVDAPVMLSPDAKSIFGSSPHNLFIEFGNTVTDRPLTTQLIRQVASESEKAVVSIYVKTKTPYRLRLLPFSPFRGIRINVPGIGLGSGFFIHPSGYLLTNSHVVENAEQIRILTSAGKDYEVNVLARDPGYDLALLKVKEQHGQRFPALAMGNSDVVEAGDIVIAIGNPLGLGHTVTSGIISQTDRDLMNLPIEVARKIKFIQTDAAINPGSSGGPLITLERTWIGVNTAGITEAQGLSFAVPSSQVREFLDAVLKGKGETEKTQN